MWRLIGMVFTLPLGCVLIYHYDRRAGWAARLLFGVGGTLCVGVALRLGFFPMYNEGCQNNSDQGNFHGGKSVAVLHRHRDSGVFLYVLGPTGFRSLGSHLSPLFLGHGLEPTLPADLTTFLRLTAAMYAESSEGGVGAVTASGPSTSFVERSTIHLASWFGSRGSFPLPMVMA
jgi:hypothetical protein